MNIPLDRLYYYIENFVKEIHKERVIIYRFWPHGSKNICDLGDLNNSATWVDSTVHPAFYCHDQEPLDYEFYNSHNVAQEDLLKQMPFLSSTSGWSRHKNLNFMSTIFEKGLLLHSEKRSCNLEKYQLDNNLLPIYYWSHAVISRDWFRYAQHENFQKHVKKIFLIYNRAWSGSREYRLQFVDLLIYQNLLDHCQTTCNVIEPELLIHYQDHVFKNPVWRPKNMLENFLQPTTAESTSSADFNTADYNSTDIEVVLETLFDDERLHLTEKSLRPIACKQPFILVATRGSLEYLHNYGFKTYHDIWDESYDQIVDPQQRLIAVTDLMKEISEWDDKTRHNNMSRAQAIADYNQQWFFSKEFFELVISELKTNLTTAFSALDMCNNYLWRRELLDIYKQLLIDDNLPNFVKTENLEITDLPTKEDLKFVINYVENKLSKN